MKVISIKQPWATLIALGEKQFETRSWATKHRGPLAIHASKKIDIEACKYLPITATLNKHGIVQTNDLPVGKIIATSNLVDCYQVETDELLWADFTNGKTVDGFEYLFGDYSEGRFAWKLENIVTLPEPIPAKGQLSLWNLPTSDFEVVYEVPPMRGLYRTVINAVNASHVEDIVRTDPEMMNYRIKEINAID
ncbi:ASCH domain-containing protein [Robertmurraya siralis]|uniref:ASCH domain-containing protein n=1 Tax=Robertmurraya siralis TaxID=77777 RepID=UPI0010F9DCAD|nr:ASCH domain-containing protein [Robertmurraya siralis]